MTHNELKSLSKLLLNKFRNESDSFLIEGEKILIEAIASNAHVQKIFVEVNSQNKFETIIKFAKNKNIEVDFIKESEISKICDSQTPQGIAALVKKMENVLATNHFILAIENVQDPGNVGTIIRNCDWFGFPQIILSSDSVDLYNPKLIRATMGSLFHLNVFESTNFYDDLISLNRKGYKLLCADLEGTDFKEMELSNKTVLVFCNESKGPTENLLKLNPHKVTIKKFGNAESLNVANASAVFLSEFAYRRK